MTATMHSMVAGLQFRDLEQCHHGREHDYMQADLAIEKELSLLHLDLWAAGREVVGLA